MYLINTKKESLLVLTIFCSMLLLNSVAESQAQTQSGPVSAPKLDLTRFHWLIHASLNECYQRSLYENTYEQINRLSNLSVEDKENLKKFLAKRKTQEDLQLIGRYVCKRWPCPPIEPFAEHYWLLRAILDKDFRNRIFDRSSLDGAVKELGPDFGDRDKSHLAEFVRYTENRVLLERVGGVLCGIWKCPSLTNP
ncbi:hypothetical protein L0222_13240 [bacterium]|nr:hypothetical protein [bacterium]